MCPQVNKEKNKTKVMVIGFDGATFDVINPLIAQGKLPHLQSLIKEGASGALRSTLPPLSATAWSTFQTGETPGKHGVFDFFRNNPEKYTCEPVNATFFKTKTLWEILSDYGKRVGVVNVIFTYPPQEVNGFVVSGKETPGEDKDYTFPACLKREILNFEPKYEADLFKQISQDKKFLHDVPVRLNCQERVHQFLLEKYPCDFFVNVFAIPDVLHHLFWKHLDTSHPHHNKKQAQQYVPLLEKCFQTLDDILGRRLEIVDENTTVMIVSDHGAGPVHKRVQINRWLREQGLLVLKQNGGASVRKNIIFLLRMLYGLIKKYDFLGLRRKLLGIATKSRAALTRDAIDWSRTKAYSGRVGEHGIHINLKGREGCGIVPAGKEYEQIREFIISGLSELTDSASGEKPFAKLYKREEIYQGPYISEAPDIMLNFADSPYEPGDALTGDEIFEDIERDGLSGIHRRDGILIAKGKGVKAGTKIENANICDIASTILYIMGIKAPANMDGKVLLDIFEPSFIEEQAVLKDSATELSSKTRKHEMTFTKEETEEINKRLRALGYL